MCFTQPLFATGYNEGARRSDPAGAFRCGVSAGGQRGSSTPKNQLLRTALAVRINLLTQHHQQAAVALLRFFSALQLLQAGVY